MTGPGGAQLSTTATRSGRSLARVLVLATILAVMVGSGLAASEADCRRELERWFGRPSVSGAYAGARDDIEASFNDAFAADVPCATLMSKLKEGAAKRVSPNALAQAIEAELGRLLVGRTLILESGVPSAHTSRIEPIYRTISILLLTGLHPDIIAHMLTDLVAQGTVFTDFAALGGVLLVAREAYGLTDEEILGLSHTLAESSLGPRGFEALSALIIHAQMARVSGEDTMTIINETIGHGGGVIQVDQALDRRMHSR